MFNDIFIENEKLNKRTLTFNENSLSKKFYTKTVIDEITIFAFMTNGGVDFLKKYILEGLAALADIESSNLFIDRQNMKISDFGILRNFYRSCREMDFSNDDVKAFIHLCQVYEEQSLLALVPAHN